MNKSLKTKIKEVRLRELRAEETEADKMIVERICNSIR